MTRIKTKVKRISLKLDDLLNGIRDKNKITFVSASDLVADMVNERKAKKKVMREIRRQIEF